MNDVGHKALSLLLGVVVFMSGCVTQPIPITGDVSGGSGQVSITVPPIVLPPNVTIPTIVMPSNVTLVSTEQRNAALTSLTYEISKLPKFDMDTIESEEKYKEFADRINDIITFLNKEGGELELLKGTSDEWHAISNKITEYGPLVENYNRVIDASTNFNPNNETMVTEFYTSSATFGIEFSLIYFSVYYEPAYGMTGYVYRTLGLNKLAFKCPTCISIALGEAHWFIRTTLVEGSSQIADSLVSGEVWNLLKDGITIPLDDFIKFASNYVPNWTD